MGIVEQCKDLETSALDQVRKGFRQPIDEDMLEGKARCTLCFRLILVWIYAVSMDDDIRTEVLWKDTEEEIKEKWTQLRKIAKETSASAQIVISDILRTDF